MIRVFTFTLDGQDIEFTLNKGKIAYVFEVNNRRYGNAVKIESRPQEAIMTATLNLIINYLETYAKAKERKD